MVRFVNAVFFIYLALEEVADGVGVAFDLEADFAEAQVAFGDFDITLHRLISLEFGYNQIERKSKIYLFENDASELDDFPGELERRHRVGILGQGVLLLLRWFLFLLSYSA